MFHHKPYTWQNSGSQIMGQNAFDQTDWRTDILHADKYQRFIQVYTIFCGHARHAQCT